VDGVLNEIGPCIDESFLIISVAAGYTIERMQNILGAQTRIGRTMPNTPSLVGAGCGAYSLNESATPEDSATVKIFMDSVGISYELKENLLDAVSGLSGSGPAYVYMFIEALADGGVK
jgi:pyrroline-5-carboxylate reductase